jgi:hypothetical protein
MKGTGRVPNLTREICEKLNSDRSFFKVVSLDGIRTLKAEFDKVASHNEHQI